MTTASNWTRERGRRPSRQAGRRAPPEEASATTMANTHSPKSRRPHLEWLLISSSQCIMRLHDSRRRPSPPPSSRRRRSRGRHLLSPPLRLHLVTIICSQNSSSILSRRLRRLLSHSLSLLPTRLSARLVCSLRSVHARTRAPKNLIANHQSHHQRSATQSRTHHSTPDYVVLPAGATLLVAPPWLPMPALSPMPPVISSWPLNAPWRIGVRLCSQSQQP